MSSHALIIANSKWRMVKLKLKQTWRGTVHAPGTRELLRVPLDYNFITLLCGDPNNLPRSNLSRKRWQLGQLPTCYGNAFEWNGQSAVISCLPIYHDRSIVHSKLIFVSTRSNKSQPTEEMNGGNLLLLHACELIRSDPPTPPPSTWMTRDCLVSCIFAMQQ